MIPKCICEGDFDGEQTHRSNPMAVCPVCDDCEWCGKAKASESICDEKVCKTCYDKAWGEEPGAMRTLENAEALLVRWNKAVTKYTPLAGSEYIDDPERTMEAVSSWARLVGFIDSAKRRALDERVKFLEDSIKHIRDTTFNQSLQLLCTQALEQKEPA